MDLLKLHRILVATDFSPASEGAVEWAHLLSQRVGAELVFLHALFLDPALLLASTEAAVDLHAQLVEHNRREALALLRQLEERFPGARGLLQEGPPREAVLRAIREVEADLVCMGTHGRTGLPRLVFGSVAQHVVVHSPVPVLTVRADHRPPQVRCILVPTDFSPAADAALPWAGLLGQAFDARVVLLHVVEVTYEALVELAHEGRFEPVGEVILRQLEERARTALSARAQQLPRCETVIRVGVGAEVPRHRIGEVAREVDADLIVMGTHGRTGIERVLLGSVAEHIVRASPIPVLTVRHRP